MLWCLTERAAREWGTPYGPGLIAFGLDPAMFLIVQARNALDAAWALEEGLKARAFVAALGQIEVKAPLIARRLGLAAQSEPHAPACSSPGIKEAGFPARSTAGAWRRRQATAPSSMPPLLARQLGISPLSAAGTWRPREVGPWSFVMSRIVSVWLPAFADRAAEAGETRQALSG